MTEEPWNKHTPGDPMPCKCGESVVEVRFSNSEVSTDPSGSWEWGKLEFELDYEITDWRFVERKGEDVIAEPLPREKQIELMAGAEERHAAFAARVTAADPYAALEWDEDGITTVVLKEPGQPEWVRDDDLVRFERDCAFVVAFNWTVSWNEHLAFQIKRRPVLTPAEPQLLALLSVATDDEADVIRSAARRANIEVPE